VARWLPGIGPGNFFHRMQLRQLVGQEVIERDASQ